MSGRRHSSASTDIQLRQDRGAQGSASFTPNLGKMLFSLMPGSVHSGSSPRNSVNQDSVGGAGTSPIRSSSPRNSNVSNSGASPGQSVAPAQLHSAGTASRKSGRHSLGGHGQEAVPSPELFKTVESWNTSAAPGTGRRVVGQQRATSSQTSERLRKIFAEQLEKITTLVVEEHERIIAEQVLQTEIMKRRFFALQESSAKKISEIKAEKDHSALAHGANAGGQDAGRRSHYSNAGAGEDAGTAAGKKAPQQQGDEQPHRQRSSRRSASNAAAAEEAAKESRKSGSKARLSSVKHADDSVQDEPQATYWKKVKDSHIVPSSVRKSAPKVSVQSQSPPTLTVDTVPQDKSASTRSLESSPQPPAPATPTPAVPVLTVLAAGPAVPLPASPQLQPPAAAPATLGGAAAAPPAYLGPGGGGDAGAGAAGSGDAGAGGVALPVLPLVVPVATSIALGPSPAHSWSSGRGSEAASPTVSITTVHVAPPVLPPEHIVEPQAALPAATLVQPPEPLPPSRLQVDEQAVYPSEVVSQPGSPSKRSSTEKMASASKLARAAGREKMSCSNSVDMEDDISSIGSEQDDISGKSPHHRGSDEAILPAQTRFGSLRMRMSGLGAKLLPDKVKSFLGGAAGNTASCGSTHDEDSNYPDNDDADDEDDSEETSSEEARDESTEDAGAPPAGGFLVMPPRLSVANSAMGGRRLGLPCKHDEDSDDDLQHPSRTAVGFTDDHEDLLNFRVHSCWDPPVATRSQAQRSKSVIALMGAGSGSARMMFGVNEKMSESDESGLERNWDVVLFQVQRDLQKRGITGKAAADAKRKAKLNYQLSRLMWSPNRVNRMMWDLLGAFLVAYEAIVVPLLFINFKGNDATLVLGWVTRIFWTLDLPISLFTRYTLPDGRMQNDPIPVFKNYLSTWFVLDATMVSLDWAEKLAGSDEIGTARIGRTLKVVRMMKLVRLARLFREKKLPDNVRNNIDRVIRVEGFFILMNIIKIVVFIVWINHFIACLWYGIVQNELEYREGVVVVEDPVEFKREPNMYTYLTMFHRSMINFAGDTDLYSNSSIERMYAAITLLFAFLASSAVVSSITTSMTRLSIATAHNANKIASLKRYLSDNCISARVALRIQRNAVHALEERRRYTPEKEIELLPLVSEPLRVELHFEIYMPVLKAHKFWEKYSELAPILLRQVCHQAIERMQLSKGDVLFSAGEVPKVPQMYFLHAGKLRYDRTAEQSHTVHKGEWACEAVLWTQWMHYGMMRTKTECTLVVLKADDFAEICKQYMSQIQYARDYAKAFVQHLNSSDEMTLTDLEDPEMDVIWLAERTHPHKKGTFRRQQSGKRVTGIFKTGVSLMRRGSSEVIDAEDLAGLVPSPSATSFTFGFGGKGAMVSADSIQADDSSGDDDSQKGG